MFACVCACACTSVLRPSCLGSLHTANQLGLGRWEMSGEGGRIASSQAQPGGFMKLQWSISVGVSEGEQAHGFSLLPSVASPCLPRPTVFATCPVSCAVHSITETWPGSQLPTCTLQGTFGFISPAKWVWLAKGWGLMLLFGGKNETILQFPPFPTSKPGCLLKSAAKVHFLGYCLPPWSLGCLCGYQMPQSRGAALSPGEQKAAVSLIPSSLITFQPSSFFWRWNKNPGRPSWLAT